MGFEEYRAAAQSLLDEGMPDVDRMRMALETIRAEAEEVLRQHGTAKGRREVALSPWSIYDLAERALSADTRERRRASLANQSV